MIYKKQATIGYSTIAKHGVLKIVSIMNFLQDAASEHSAIMGISGFDLAKENLAWVIARYHIEIKNHPAWQDKVTITTHRFPCKNLYEIRNINIKNDISESELVNARGCWVMVSKKNRKPVRLSKFMDKDMCENTILIAEPLRINEELKSYFPEIIKPEKINYQLPFKVRMHDLDLNGHVNNAIYVKWGVESVPEDILSKFSPSIIDIIFKTESLYGDMVISNTEIREKLGIPVTLHSIVRQQDQKELAILNISWQSLSKTNSNFYN